SASIDLGGLVSFSDDGPSVEVQPEARDDIDALQTADALVGEADNTDSLTLSSLFSVASSSYGADGEAGSDAESWSYSLNLLAEAGSVATSQAGGNLQSGDADVRLFQLANGSIVGSTAAEGADDAAVTDNQVFTLRLEDGELVLEQHAALDHSDSDSDDYSDEVLNLAKELVELSGTVTVTDGDGDTAEDTTQIDLGGLVGFSDDGPTFDDGGIDDASLSAAADSETTGDLNLDIGADLEGAQIADATLKTDGDGHIQVDYQDDGSTNTTYLTSGGEKLLYSFDESSQRLTAYKDGDSSQSPVFTIDFDATGNIYQVNVVEALDPVAVSFAAAGFENKGGGIAGNLSFEGTELEAVFTSSEGSVNWSNNGIGAGNNLIGEGETLYAQFNEVLTQLDFEMGNDGDLSWEAFRGGDSVGTGSDTSISIEGGFDEVHFYGSSGGDQYNVNNFSGAYLDSSLNYQLPVDVVAADGDGDLDDSAFEIDFEPTDTSVDLPDLLLVDDNSSSPDLQTAGGNDVMVGDLGGREKVIEEGKSYNISLMLDASQSMSDPSGTSGMNRFELAKEALKNLADQLAEHDGNVNVQLVGFSNMAWEQGVFENLSPSNVGDLKDAIDAVDQQTWTNYQDAFEKSEEWFGSPGISGNGYENLAYFLTDGNPTAYNQGGGFGNDSNYAAMDLAVEAFAGLTGGGNVNVNAIGIGSGVSENYLRFFDNTNVTGEATEEFGGGGMYSDGQEVTGPVGQPSIVNTAEELQAALESGSEDVEFADLGDDVLRGNDGDDIIFGDSVNSDHLAWTNGDGEEFIAGEHDGMGYIGLVEYLRWSDDFSNNGNMPSDDQVIDYVRANWEQLAQPQESATPGQNELYGEAGDDILIGGAGDDLLQGGEGNDTLFGGVGADTFVWDLADNGEEGSPAEDTVMDFDGDEGDVLNLSDLLQDRDEESDISNYLHIEDDGEGGSVIHVSTKGGFEDGFDPSAAEQTIILKGVAYEPGMLDDMLQSGQINIDQ
ncbi:MAG: type I secretion C-terminal target domain-containing protein, partial [Pseudomonadota bacterium]